MNKKKRKKKGMRIALAVFVILAAAAGLDLLERREEILKDMEDLSLYRSNPVVTAPMEGCIMTLDTLEGTVCHAGKR